MIDLNLVETRKVWRYINVFLAAKLLQALEIDSGGRDDDDDDADDGELYR